MINFPQLRYPGKYQRAITFSSSGPIAEKQILITDAYLIAAKGDLLAFNTKYALPVDWGVIRKVSFYHDVSVLLKHESAFENSVIQTTSVMFNAKPVWFYIDLITSQNAIYLNGQNTPMVQGVKDPGRNTRLNIVLGYWL